MNQLEQKIIDFIKENQGINNSKLLKEFLNKYTNLEIFNALYNLKTNKKVVFHNKKTKRYYFVDNHYFFIGRLYLNKKIIYKIKEWWAHSYEVYDVNLSFLQDANPHDLVLFKLVDNLAEIFCVVDKNQYVTVGIIVRKANYFLFLPDDRNFYNKPIRITNYKNNYNLVSNLKVSIKNIHEEENYFSADIDKIIGHKNDPDTEILMCALKFGIKKDFNSKTLKNTNDVAKKYYQSNKKAFTNRKDLSDKYFVTIDGKTAKDLDDAICIEKTNDSYKLLVSIADVSHFVNDASDLDLEAQERGNSFYLLNKVIPMLPHKLSDDLCSLNPNEKKLTLTCDMTFDFNGKLTNYSVYESFIVSKERLNYFDVNQYFKNHKINNIKNTKILDNAFELYNQIKRNFYNNGFLQIKTKECQIVVDKNNKPIAIKLREQHDAEKLIEFFMLSANVAVANFLDKNKLPGVFRVHNKPVETIFFDALNIIKIMKSNIKIVKNYHDINSKYIQYLLNIFNDEEDEQYIVNALILKSMDKAKYNYINNGHFAIGVKQYCHFTSPIRRYADLYVHRIIKEFLNKTKINFDNKIQKINEFLPQINSQELISQHCERYINKIKKAQYLFLTKTSNTYNAIISSVKPSGLFLELANSIEGFISIRNVGNDFFEFNAKRHSLVGQKIHKEFSIGQRHLVYVKFINRFNGNITFSFAKDYENY